MNGIRSLKIGAKCEMAPIFIHKFFIKIRKCNIETLYSYMVNRIWE